MPDAARKIRIGVVGCGVMGPKHLEAAAALDTAEAFAAADLIESRVREAAGRFSLKKTFLAGTDLVADPDVDAVVLAFPAAGRAELAVEALNNGKHVLVEKPVARDSGEVRAMMAARGDKLVAGCCSHRFRFYEHAKVAADFLRDQPLGRLRLVRARQLASCGAAPESPRPDWRLRRDLNGGGILFNWGCYDIDYLLGLTGWRLKPETVFAQTWPLPPRYVDHAAPGSDAETYYTALVRCADDCVISLERGEYMPAVDDAAWQIIGEHGSLRMRMTPGEGKQLIHDAADAARGVVSRVLWQGDEGWSGPQADAPVRDFCRAILTGEQPATGLERALVIQRISDAIIESARTGHCVSV